MPATLKVLACLLGNVLTMVLLISMQQPISPSLHPQRTSVVENIPRLRAPRSGTFFGWRVLCGITCFSPLFPRPSGRCCDLPQPRNELTCSKAAGKNRKRNVRRKRRNWVLPPCSFFVAPREPGSIRGVPYLFCTNRQVLGTFLEDGWSTGPSAVSRELPVSPINVCGPRIATHPGQPLVEEDWVDLVK
jgi:hypothetical protein